MQKTIHTRPNKMKSASNPIIKVTHLSDPLTGIVRSRLRLRLFDGKEKDVEMARSELANPSRLNTVLLDVAANSPRFNQSDATQLAKMTRKNTVVEARVPAWFGDSFAFPDRIISYQGAPLKFCSKDAAPEPLKPLFEMKGDTMEWAERLAPIVRASDIATFAIGVAFAGPLVRFSTVSEGAIFNLVGASGGGKTLVLLLAQAVMGKAERQRLPSWDHTLTGLEHYLERNGELACLLDDTSRDRGKQTGRSRLLTGAGHLIAGGGKRGRSEVYDAQRPAMVRGACYGLSSGEERLSELAKTAGAGLIGGELPRFIDIPVPKEGGIFNIIRPDEPTGMALAKQAERAVKASYGTPFRDYLDFLDCLQPDLKRYIRDGMDTFIELWGQGRENRPPSPTESRIAKKFALVYAALLLLNAMSAAPVSRKRAFRAVKYCLDAALSQPHSPTEQITAGLDNLRKALADQARCPTIVLGQLPPGDVFRRARSPKGRTQVHITEAEIASLAGAPLTLVPALTQELLKLKVLIPGRKSNTRQTRFGGKRKRFYILDEACWPPTQSTE